MSRDSVRFQCPHCGQVSEGSSQYIGTESACPNCGKSFLLKASTNTHTSELNAFGCYLAMFRRYFGFRGRTVRREFWWAMLLHLIALLICGFVDGLVLNASENQSGMIAGLYTLATLIPLTALQVRRLHDTNKSGWWALLAVLPVLNVAYIVWLATAGDKGKNRFGDDPKY